METAGRCVLQNRRYDRKVMFILYGAKANRRMGKSCQLNYLVFKLLAKLEGLKFNLDNCVDTYKMAPLTATIRHTASSDISSNKT